MLNETRNIASLRVLFETCFSYRSQPSQSTSVSSPTHSLSQPIAVVGSRIRPLGVTKALEINTGVERIVDSAVAVFFVLL